MSATATSRVDAGTLSIAPALLPFRLKLAVKPNPYVGTLGVFLGAGITTLFGRLLSIGLPDLRGRVPIHQGNGFVLAEQGGVEEVTLTVNQIPVHSHALFASGDLGNQLTTTGNLLSNSQGAIPYIEDVTTLNMSSSAITPVGGSQPHTNFQPYLCVNFIISVFGIYPSQT